MRFILSQLPCRNRPRSTQVPFLVLIIATIFFAPMAARAQQSGVQTFPPVTQQQRNAPDPADTNEPPKLPLLASPNSMGILVGDPYELRITDSNGRRMIGATWSVRDPAIARLDESRGITVVGVSPGTTIVTGTWRDQTVQVKVRVLGALDGKKLAADWAANAPEPKLNPALARKVDTIGDAYFHYQHGLELFDAGNMQGAYDEFWEALQQKPDYVEAQTKLAYTLWKGGEPQGAIVAAKHALVLNPNNTDAERTIGLALMDTGDLKGAVSHFQAALRLMPNSSDAHYDLGIAFNKLGDHATSIQEYRDALRIDPSMQRAHYNLARELRETGDLPDAVAEDRESARLTPNNPNALINLAASLKRSNDLEGARHYYQAAIDIDPSIFEAHNGLGQTLSKMNDWAGAARELAIAAQLYPREYTTWYSLGLALQSLRDDAGALKAFTRAHQLEPADPIVREHYEEALRAAHP